MSFVWESVRAKKSTIAAIVDTIEVHITLSHFGLRPSRHGEKARVAQLQVSSTVASIVQESCAYLDQAQSGPDPSCSHQRRR